MLRKAWGRVPYVFLGGVALAISLVWVFVWPQDRAAGATGIEYLVIRWGHTLVWFLLGLSCLGKAWFPKHDVTSNRIAALGGLVYGVFVIISYVF